MKGIERLKRNVEKVNEGINTIIDSYVNSQVKTLEDIAGLDPEMIQVLKTSAELMKASEEMLEDTVAVYNDILKNQEDIKRSLNLIEMKIKTA